jgi:hypothetical protein
VSLPNCDFYRNFWAQTPKKSRKSKNKFVEIYPDVITPNSTVWKKSQQ